MKDDYIGALLQVIGGKLKRLAEGMTGLSEKVERIRGRLESIETNTDLIPAIKQAVTDQSRQLKDHEMRVSSPEATP